MLPLDEPHVEVDGRVVPFRLWESEQMVRAAAMVLQTQALAAVLTSLSLIGWVFLARAMGGGASYDAGFAGFADLAIALMLWRTGSRIRDRHASERTWAIAAVLIWMGFLAYLLQTRVMEFQGASADLPEGFRRVVLAPLRWYPPLLAVFILVSRRAGQALEPVHDSRRLSPLISVPCRHGSGIAWASYFTVLLSILSVLLYLPCVGAW